HLLLLLVLAHEVAAVTPRAHDLLPLGLRHQVGPHVEAPGQYHPVRRLILVSLPLGGGPTRPVTGGAAPEEAAPLHPAERHADRVGEALAPGGDGLGLRRAPCLPGPRV